MNRKERRVQLRLEERQAKKIIKEERQKNSIVNELVSKLEALTKKYEITFAEVEAQISETENTLSAMIDELEGNEFDMLGLSEFKKMLGGVQND